jgi:rod shape-determining protein MreB
MIGAQTIYVRLFRNKLRLRSIEAGTEIEVSPSAPFTSQRLLIGDFLAAERTLKDGLRQVTGGGWFKPSPRILMHQLEMTEGGLSDVEQRILRELAIGAGAMKVEIWTGPNLTDQEVVEKLAAK